MPVMSKRRWVSWTPAEEDAIAAATVTYIMSSHSDPESFATTLDKYEGAKLPKAVATSLLGFFRSGMFQAITVGRWRDIASIKQVAWLPDKVKGQLRAKLQLPPPKETPPPAPPLPEPHRNGQAPKPPIIPPPDEPGTAPEPAPLLPKTPQDEPVYAGLVARIEALEGDLASLKGVLADLESNYTELLGIATNPDYKPSKPAPPKDAPKPDAPLPTVYLFGYSPKHESDIRAALRGEVEVKAEHWSPLLDPKKYIDTNAAHYFCMNTVKVKWIDLLGRTLGHSKVSKASYPKAVIDKARKVAKPRRA